MENKETEIHEDILFAESIFGNRERRGLVKLSHGISWEITITPSEARIYALSILEAAEAAEQDAFLMRWLRAEIGLSDDEAAVNLLRRFREMRIDCRVRDLKDAKDYAEGKS
jgi:hypothetical protein